MPVWVAVFTAVLLAAGTLAGGWRIPTPSATG